VAYVRGANLASLKELGFVVLAPFLEDYVFLEASGENVQLVEDAGKLGVEFLASGEDFSTISGRELEDLVARTTGKIKAGLRIRVVSGEVAGLEGEVLEVDGELAFCTLTSYLQTYERWIPTEFLLPA
jgi:hypothetical protein